MCVCLQKGGRKECDQRRPGISGHPGNGRVQNRDLEFEMRILILIIEDTLEKRARKRKAAKAKQVLISLPRRWGYSSTSHCESDM